MSRTTYDIRCKSHAGSVDASLPVVLDNKVDSMKGVAAMTRACSLAKEALDNLCETMEKL